MKKPSFGRDGFSLIELLTVIAIIAILAAVIFPVMGSVREKARQNSCMSNLHNIWMTLKLYKLDERSMPPALGVYVVNVGGQPQNVSQLYPEYLKNRAALQCPDNPSDDPNVIVPLSARQPWTASPKDIATVAPNDPVVIGAQFPATDAYDGVVGPDGKYQLRYCRWRTLNPNDPDYKRQLAFRNPPDDTVVTWCSYHRSLSVSGVKGDDLVLFMSGTVERHPAAEMEQLGWRVRPKSG